MNANFNRLDRVSEIAVRMFLLGAFVSTSRADIFQWEYVNPADPSQGRQQSTTLAPDGAGVDSVPGADLVGRDLTMASLPGANFFSAHYSCGDFGCDYLIEVANLTATNLSRADLNGANLAGATLTDANFTRADIRRASFDKAWGQFFHNSRFVLRGTGITLSQLYSTASYQEHDLTGVRFYSNFLAGGNFAGQNLTDSFFESANLTGADFTGAEVRGTSFDFTGITIAQLHSTVSYQHRDLTGIGLGGIDLHGEDFAGYDLTNARFSGATLTGANLRDATLTNAGFVQAKLSDADFTGAQVIGVNFSAYPNLGTGVTLAQLYSTASYRAHDLRGIGLEYNNLAGGNFVAKNLAGADFFAATLIGAGFDSATLTDASFSSANLTDASFYGASMTDADLTGAEIRGASFCKQLVYLGTVAPKWLPLGSGLTIEQIYSTASYQARDLSGINFSYNILAGANFAGQNLTNAQFYGAQVEAADFTGADVRGASFDIIRIDDENRFPKRTFLFGSGISLAQLYSTASYQERDIRGVSGIVDAIPTVANLILPNGHIQGLDLDKDAALVVRDYDGDLRSCCWHPATPITVNQHFAMGPGGTLRMVFEADAWDSTISFAPGIPVRLGGTLELTFADDVNLASQVGRTFDLFDWTGVNPTGAFAIPSPFQWDLSNLYTTGEVILTAVPENASVLLVAALGLLQLPLRQRAQSRTYFLPQQPNSGKHS